MNAAALPSGAGIPIDFILFACTLAGVALFHKHVLKIAVTGLVVITLYKLLFSPFATGAGVPGLPPCSPSASCGSAQTARSASIGLKPMSISERVSSPAARPNAAETTCA